MKESSLSRSGRTAGRSLPVLLLASLLAGCAALQASPASSVARCRPEAGCDGRQADRPLRILFIGNSLTYYNNLPCILEQLAASADPPRRLQTRLVGFGGATLKSHWEKGVALRAVRADAWDYVVLQEQSALGTVYMVDGVRYVTPQPELFHRYARLFAAEIGQAGAKAIFFLTWARKGRPPREQAALNYAYIEIARELGALVAPVGIAWQDAQAGDTGIDLYLGDGSHPSPAGSYLAACVFYAVLFGESPRGLKTRIEGNPIDDRGIVNTYATVPLVDLPGVEAAWLQRVAWQARRKLAAAGGYPAAPRPPPPKLPVLPAGHRPAAAELEGLWKGEIKLYPRPGKMELRLSRSGDAWDVQGRISFGRGEEDHALAVVSFEVTEEGISFVDSKEYRGGSARYRAAFRGTSLAGIAEIGDPGGSFYAVGSWEVKRRRQRSGAP